MLRRPSSIIIHTGKMVILSKDEFQIVKLKLKRDKKTSVKIVSGSMIPLIQIDEKVVVQEKESYDLFDVVIYHCVDGRLICHYIWGESSLNKGHYLLRSLQGGGLDHPVSHKQILGHVPDKKIDFKMKLLIFFKMFTQRIRRGVFLLAMISLFSSCTNLGYLMQQGVGQIQLQMGGQKNEDVLKDPDISVEKKEKIRQIQKYKKFFLQLL